MSAPSTEGVRVTDETERPPIPDTPPSSKDGVSGLPERVDLKRLLDDYVERGTTRGFRDWAEQMGWRVVKRRGCWAAYNGDRLVAAAVVTVRGAPHRQMSRMPCATCGSLPIGDYPSGRTVDERRRYGCGPHPLVVSAG